MAKVKSSIKSNSKLCFVKDKNGGTPLHMVAMKGRIVVLRILVDACPDSVQEVTASGETCLHTAVVYNKGKIVQYLVKWLAENQKYSYLINAKDHDGHTPLHLATSRRQLQIVKVLLSCNLVDVNAVNSGGITALDILYVLPHSGKIDMELDKIFRRAGSLRTKDLTNHEANCNFNHESTKERHKSLSFMKLKKKRCFVSDRHPANRVNIPSNIKFFAVQPQRRVPTKARGFDRRPFIHIFQLDNVYRIASSHLIHPT